MLLTTVNTHILQQVILKLHQLQYNEVVSLIESLTYHLQNHTFEDENTQRNPVGFNINNTSTEEDNESDV